MGEEQKPLARAFDHYLYPSDVEDILKGRSPEDSARMVKMLVEKWLQRQLLLKKAKDNIPEDDPAIMRKVEDYREALLLYEYEKALISEKLDTSISPSELEKYYQDFGYNYLLANDIYLVQFIKLKEDAPELKDFKKLLFNINTQEDEERVEGYCKANAIAYAYAHPLWYNSDHLTSFFLLSDREVGQLTSSERFREFNKEEGILTFIRVRQVKRRGSSRVDLQACKLGTGPSFYTS
jgi:hypothetical protein